MSDASGTTGNVSDEKDVPKQISVAELLARNGQQVASAAGGRRRRGVKGGISVAELTGDLPIIEDVPPAESRPSTHGAPDPEPEVMRKEPTRSSAPRSFDRATRYRPDNASNAVESTREARPADKPAEFGGLRGSGSLGIDDAPPVGDAAPADTSASAEQYDQPSGTNAMAWSSTQREPQLLSGSTVAGDLMRGAEQARDSPFPAADTATDEQDEAEHEPSAMRQWLVLLGEAVVAVVAGALLFKGFERMWDMLPWVAFALAILVILGLVAMVRILRKTDDILSIVIAIVVGLFVTMGPLVFLLSTS